MRTRHLRCLPLLIALLAPTTASAQWAVNGNPVSTAFGAQDGIDMVANGLNGAVMVWQDNRSSLADIYAQQINQLGVNEWTANGVAVCTATGLQQYPRVVHDGFGYLVYAWEDYRAGNADVYAAITDRLGNVFTPANGIALGSGTGDQRAVSLASNQSLGVAYAVWTDTRSGNNDIYAQAFNHLNYDFWTTGGLPFCTLTSDQTGAVIAPDGGDGAIVAWQDYRSGTSYDIYAQRANLSNQLLWTANGVPICTSAAAQTSPMIISDGAGGAIIAWQDQRHGVLIGSIYAQRVNSSGVPQWTANGVPIVISTDLIILPKMISDGAGGAIFVWQDDRNIATTGDDIYAQRVNASGVVQWAVNGVVVCNASYSQATVDIAPDGAGGVVAAWQDVRTLGPADVYAQRLNGSGVPQWTANGVPVSTASGNQFNAQIVQTESGASIVSWEDRRTGNIADVYAQRIQTSDGAYGYRSPYIMSIVDVPNDQGGWVRLTFRAGDGDLAGTEYEIYNGSYHGGDLVDLVTNNGNTYYTRDVFTVGVGTSEAFWVNGSNVVYGTSIDNLAPPAPTLTGARDGNAVNLSWNVPAAPDVDHYQVERVGTGIIASPTATSFQDNPAPLTGLTYHVRAVDTHGNAGPYSNDLVIATPTGVGDAPAIPAVLTLMPNTPNPFTSATSLRIGMPGTGDARLEVFDVAGRRVASRDLGVLQAGWRDVAFDARDDHGQPLASGVYLYRVHAAGESHTRKMVISR